MPCAGRRCRENRCVVEPRHRRMRSCRPHQYASNQQSRARRMKASLKPRNLLRAAEGGTRLFSLGTYGSVAAEFALTAPTLILLVAAIADFGMLAIKSAGLAAAAGIGAEYARAYPDDVRGIQHDVLSA